MTPCEAIRSFCVECVGSVYDVHKCGGNRCKNGGSVNNEVCWFYPYRMGMGRPSVKTIRKTCLWCMGESEQLVRECWTPECALHPFRMGRNPNITEETRRKRQLLAQAQGFTKKAEIVRRLSA